MPFSASTSRKKVSWVSCGPFYQINNGGRIPHGLSRATCWPVRFCVTAPWSAMLLGITELGAPGIDSSGAWSQRMCGRPLSCSLKE